MLLAHAPILYRAVSLRQINTEDEERIFRMLKDVTKRTSSMRPGEIDYNVLIRIQEEITQGFRNKSDKKISKHAAQATKPINTTITRSEMQNRSHHWQALLQNIADYLVQGENIWWRKLPNGDIEFFDIRMPTPREIPKQLSKLHFRKLNAQSIQAHLSEKWRECIEKKVSYVQSSINETNEEQNKISGTLLTDCEENMDTALSSDKQNEGVSDIAVSIWMSNDNVLIFVLKKTMKWNLTQPKQHRFVHNRLKSPLLLHLTP